MHGLRESVIQRFICTVKTKNRDQNFLSVTLTKRSALTEQKIDLYQLDTANF